jgi:hypothetical protein
MIHETAQELFDALCAPFPVEFIEWRIGSTNTDKSKGLALCYVDARAVMDRLDTICGPDGWQCNYTPGVNGSIICNIGIQMPGTAHPVPGAPKGSIMDCAGAWIWKADGAGATDVEGEKGALSDAFKRAAVRWGVGRYLYDLKAPWVPIENKKIPEAEIKKLDSLHEDFAQKCGWGLRAGVQAYKLMNQMVRQFVTDSATAQDFKTKNASMIAQLPVGMRNHLNESLDRIGGTQAEAAQ